MGRQELPNCTKPTDIGDLGGGRGRGSEVDPEHQKWHQIPTWGLPNPTQLIKEHEELPRMIQDKEISKFPTDALQELLFSL